MLDEEVFERRASRFAYALGEFTDAATSERVATLEEIPLLRGRSVAIPDERLDSRAP